VERGILNKDLPAINNNLDIGPLKMEEIILYNLTISNEIFNDGIYTIATRLLGVNGELDFKAVNFSIRGLSKGPLFQVLICSDRVCKEKSKIFLRNEDIYMNYRSTTKNSKITATLTFPNQRKVNLNLPSSIKAIQIGTYELEVIASKPGYKTINTKELFGVIEEEPEIKDLFEEKFNYRIFLIPALVIIIILVILILIRRRKQYVNQQNYDRQYYRR